MATRLVEFPGAQIIVEGHTDSMGADEYNRKLSERRAAAVRGFLHLAPETSSVKGYGEARPLAPNDTEEGRQRNRRVEIVVIPAPVKR
ncbi:MAG: OmpA family protein [Myxococcaceae bacterium]